MNTLTIIRAAARRAAPRMAPPRQRPRGRNVCHSCSPFLLGACPSDTGGPAQAAAMRRFFLPVACFQRRPALAHLDRIPECAASPRRVSTATIHGVLAARRTAHEGGSLFILETYIGPGRATATRKTTGRGAGVRAAPQ